MGDEGRMGGVEGRVGGVEGRVSVWAVLRDECGWC